MTARWLAPAAFLFAVVLANWLTDRFGMVTVAPGLVATAGTFAAGATFTLRDTVHDDHGRRRVVALIVAGAALAALVAGPALAVASGVAFLVAELADLTIYEPLRDRGRRDAAVWASVLVGAPIDSVLFLALAFGTSAVTGLAVGGHVIGKIEATAAVWLLLRWRHR